MKTISNIQAVALIAAMICINSSMMSQYLFPMNDFINGVLKGIGIGLSIFVIVQTQSKKKNPKTNQ